jgi:hypothetical protein
MIACLDKEKVDSFADNCRCIIQLHKNLLLPSYLLDPPWLILLSLLLWIREVPGLDLEPKAEFILFFCCFLQSLHEYVEVMP